ncbi:MAG TPA: transcriptional regulator [Pyrinomonadaceae bacterium]|nr:transcriptional regulator [Pyrinomonadaceae bacterium]
MARHAALPKDAPARGRHTSETTRGELQRGPQQKGHAKTATDQTAADLDRVIHERIRLAIVSALAVNQSLTFNDLKHMLNTTDGNLSVHARKLEEANYVTCTKFFDGRMPKTEYRLTASGRRALERYLSHMEAIIRKTREG